MGASHPAIGSVLGDTYRLERVLGKGGMGTVYEASHTRLPRRFAVKILLPEVVARRELFERFRREAEIASSTGHENIVEAYDFNLTDEGIPYIVMELLSGESLRSRLDRVGDLTIDETVHVVGQVAEALAVAHGLGIVHRDLKPENIFLCRRRGDASFVKVLDFGVSKLVHAETISTQTGTIIGTPQYMAPEQASDSHGNVDHRADVFALGAITYECLSGDFAFRGPNPLGVLYSVVHSTPKALHELRSDVPAALDAVVARALAKRPEDRFQNCLEFHRAIRHAVGLATVDTLRSSVSSSAPTLAADHHVEVVVKRTTNSQVETLDQAVLSSAKAPRTASRRVRGLMVAGATAVCAVVVTAVAWPSGKTAAEPAPSASSNPAPVVHLRLDVKPEDARVELDGVTVSGPTIELDRSDGTHELVVSAPGYVSQKRSFRAVTDGSLSFALKPEPPKPALSHAPQPASGQKHSAPPPVRKRTPRAARRPKPPAPSASPLGPLERKL